MIGQIWTAPETVAQIHVNYVFLEPKGSSTPIGPRNESVRGALSVSSRGGGGGG